MENIGKRIAETRKSLGLTQQALADKIDGITVQMISIYEKEKQTPSLKNLIRIAENLDVSIDYLVFGKEKRQNINNCSENNSIYDICKKVFELLEYGNVYSLSNGTNGKTEYSLFIKDKAINNFIKQYEAIKESQKYLPKEYYNVVIERILWEVSNTKYE